MTKEQSLLPKNEPEILRFLECVASDMLEHCDLESINTLPLSARAELLPYLAFMFDVDITGLSESESRRLILNAIEIHRYAGTLYAVKKALQTCFSNYEIKEWFEFGGKPFTFKLEVTIGTDFDAVFDAQKWVKARDLIYWAKNERSQLLGIEVKLPEARGDIFVSAGLVYEANPQGETRFLKRARGEFIVQNAGVASLEAENQCSPFRQAKGEVYFQSVGVAEINASQENIVYRKSQCVLHTQSAISSNFEAKGDFRMNLKTLLTPIQQGGVVWQI